MRDWPLPRRNGLKWCSREDSHLELPPSQGGVQNSYTSGAVRRASLHSACSRLLAGRARRRGIGLKRKVRHAGAAPAPAVWKTAVLAVTPMTLENGDAPALPACL